MSKNVSYVHIIIFIIVTTVLIYLGKLLYGNLNTKVNYSTTFFDEEIDEETDDSTDNEFDDSGDSDDSEVYNEMADINDSINPIPNTILTGPINDKADLSRKTIDNVSSDEDISNNSEQ